MCPPPRSDRTGVTLPHMEFAPIRSFGLGLVLLSGGFAAAAAGASTPAVVTTDTPEYCQKLFDRIDQAIQAATAPPPVEVASLSTEGRRMCNDGLTRGGILR